MNNRQLIELLQSFPSENEVCFDFKDGIEIYSFDSIDEIGGCSVIQGIHKSYTLISIK